MSNSDENQQWPDLIKMYLGVDLKPAEKVAWFLELRREVKGWSHDSLAEGDDPLKGPEAKAINAELCQVIRFIKGMDKIPRKAEGGKTGGYQGKPNVSDVQLWVWIYRKNVQTQSGATVNGQFVSKCCQHIRRLVDEGRRFDAAILSVNPIGVADCWNEIIPTGGNRGYSEDEEVEIRKFCDTINFSASDEFKRFAEKKGQNPVNATAAVFTNVKNDYHQEDEDEDLFL